MEVCINHPWVKYGLDFGPNLYPGTQGHGSDRSPEWTRPLPSPPSAAQAGGAAGAAGGATAGAGPGAALGAAAMQAKPERLIDRQLKEYKECGIKAVRWFILADGWNYGQPELKNKKWTFDPPDIGKLEHVKHFEELLKTFKDSGIKLMPCFIDYLFLGPAKVVIPSLAPPWNVDEIPVPAATERVQDFLNRFYQGSGATRSFEGSAAAKRYEKDERKVDPLKYIKGGRSAVVQPDKWKTFLDRALQPLLQVASRYKDTILAWDIINEPEMVLQYPGVTEDGRTVAFHDMRNFLEKACLMVSDAGFGTTIGFQTALSLGMNDGSTAYQEKRAGTLAKLAAALAPTYGNRKNPFIAQFHYYPEHCDQKELPAVVRNPRGPLSYAVGEFSTKQQCRWKELPKDRHGVKERLGVIKGQGYDYAFLWSGQNDQELSSWKRTEWAEVKAFTGK